MMESKDWLLLSVIEGEEESRLCGRTSVELVARAWSMGEGHRVFELPPDGKLLEVGYEQAMFLDSDFEEEK